MEIKTILYKQRQRQFIDRLKWSIESYNGGEKESDQFDTSGTYYLIIRDSTDIQGSVRLRPSKLQNLSSVQFSWLTGAVRISNDLTWEASRFTINPSYKRPKNLSKGAGIVDDRTISLFIFMLDFAIKNGINHYEVIVGRQMKKILTLAGWEMEVLSSGKAAPKEIIYYGLLPCTKVCYETMLSKCLCRTT
ncbi:hypothetical protein H1D44_20625 [Halomonas kenyensis]|uniref:Acyl-homoserine-lactone synthase n=1 Tax=Billgrantia kenyensis TaxID=321266 RepID=A0A7V9W584_9GAMM|nr:hypothetical protein [Halomonas kenyensis]MCG6663937.1 hypothetical protein [Halomonas kenyensis]